MHDAHFHMTDALLESLRERGLQGIADARSAEEFRWLSGLQREYPFLISAGVHPWDADTADLAGMLALLQTEAVPLVGEIGLDSVWCDVPLSFQREVFRTQLELAAQLKKPVILHTKGMEREIAQTIRQYPNTYLVHWYSAQEALEEYLALGCYMTVGPSVGVDPAVTRVAELVPEDRLLLETDGIEAIRWALGAEAAGFSDREVHGLALERSLRTVAQLRGLEPEMLRGILKKNFEAFTAHAGVKQT